MSKKSKFIQIDIQDLQEEKNLTAKKPRKKK